MKRRMGCLHVLHIWRGPADVVSNAQENEAWMIMGGTVSRYRNAERLGEVRLVPRSGRDETSSRLNLAIGRES